MSNFHISIKCQINCLTPQVCPNACYIDGIVDLYTIDLLCRNYCMHDTTEIQFPQSILKNLVDKNDDRRQEAGKELQIIAKKNSGKRNFNQLQKIIYYFADRYVASNDVIKKKAGVEALSFIAAGIKENLETVDRLSPLIINTILSLLNDSEHKIRFAVLKSLFYVCSSLGDKILKMFNKIFEDIIVRMTDLDQETKSAARFLDSSLKTILNSALTNSCEDFNLKEFIAILKSKLKSMNPAIRQFLIVWINILNENANVDLLQYLPEILEDLLFMLGDKEKKLRSRAEECLKNFQKEMTDKFSEGKLELMINEEILNEIVSILVKVSKGKSSVYSKIITINWFKLIFCFFKTQLDPKVKTPNSKFYFKKIIMERFDEVLEPILLLMSHEDEEVRKASSNANQLLMTAIQLVYREQTVNFSKVMPLLKHMLSQKKATSTSESALRWMKFMLENYNDKILPQVDDIIEKLVEKLCDSSGKNVISIIENTTVTEEYFQRLIEKMLALLLNKSQTDQKPEQILKRFSSILVPDEFCRTLAAQVVQKFQDSQFIFEIVHYLNLLIITEKSMLKVRQKLQKLDDFEFFHILFSAFIYNPAAAVSLCLLSQEYELAHQMTVLMGSEIEVSSGIMHSFVKLASMLQCPGFLFLRIQMLNQSNSPCLIQTLCAILMILPQGKISQMLKSRIQISKLSLSQNKSKVPAQKAGKKQLLTSTQKQQYLQKYLEIHHQFKAK